MVIFCFSHSFHVRPSEFSSEEKLSLFSPLLTQLFISVWALGYLVYSLDYGVLVIVDLAAHMSRIWLRRPLVAGCCAFAACLPRLSALSLFGSTGWSHASSPKAWCSFSLHAALALRWEGALGSRARQRCVPGPCGRGGS